jgi:hypothetical protein
MAAIPQSFVSPFIEASLCSAFRPLPEGRRPKAVDQRPNGTISPIRAITRHTDGFVGQTDPIRPKIQLLNMDYSHGEYNILLIICIDRIAWPIYQQLAYKTWK